MHIHTYTYAHTHTGQFEESLRLALFCYLVTLTVVDHKQRLRYLDCIQINSPVSSNNRDLFYLHVHVEFDSWSGVSTWSMVDAVVAWCYWESPAVMGGCLVPWEWFVPLKFFSEFWVASGSNSLFSEKFVKVFSYLGSSAWW